MVGRLQTPTWTGMQETLRTIMRDEQDADEVNAEVFKKEMIEI